MPLTQKSLENYSSRALKNMFGKDDYKKPAPESKPSNMKYTKDFFLGKKGKEKNISKKKKVLQKMVEIMAPKKEKKATGKRGK